MAGVLAEDVLVHGLDPSHHGVPTKVLREVTLHRFFVSLDLRRVRDQTVQRATQVLGIPVAKAGRGFLHHLHVFRDVADEHALSVGDGFQEGDGKPLERGRENYGIGVSPESLERFAVDGSKVIVWHS